MLPCCMSLMMSAMVTAPAGGVDLKKLDQIDGAVEAAIQRGDCPGAVVLVVHRDEVVYRKAFGLRAKVPQPVAMTVDTVFDLASLTKPVATAASIHILAERGKLRLSDPVAKYWPAFAVNGKADITIEQCLLHTTGLIADNPEADYRDGRAKALERVAALTPEVPPGTRFRYSDVGFIVLGELVEKVSGKPLDQFARENLFVPLRMTDTGYLPTAALKARVAPTGKRDGAVILGDVHDPRSFRMGGVAGHAGLFGTADDLARYCRMLLRGGELDGNRVMSAETAQAFTTVVEVPIGKEPKSKEDATRKLLRSRGWDVDTSFTSQRGTGFSRGTGFGHTGFTGTSIWVDVASETSVIVLTNRVHPDDKGNVATLRKLVGNIVGSLLRI